MDWQQVKDLDHKTLRTKLGQPFRIVSVSERVVTVEVSTGNQYNITKGSLEKAEELLRKGGVISGPGDYRMKIADERPAYAWAILRELGYVS